MRLKWAGWWLPFLLCVSVTQSVSLFAQRFETVIIDSENMASIDEWVTSDTIVLLDLDNTVFRSKTTLGSPQWFYKLVQIGVDAGLSKKTAAELAYPLWNRVTRFTAMEPCDPEIPDLIKRWQKRAYAVIGLTARWPIVAPRTAEQVRECGIALGEHRWKDQTFTFTSEPTSCFLDGILFTNENEKGEILAAFLDQVDHRGVKRLVFADDVVRNIHTVQRFADEQQLEFVGLRYAKEDARVKAYDHSIAQCQLYYLDGVLPDSVTRLVLSSPVGKELLASYSDPIMTSVRHDDTLVPTKEKGKSAVQAEGVSHDVPVKIRDSICIADLLDIADSETLIVFDLNDTLIRTATSLGGDVWADRILQNAAKAGMTKEQALDRLVPFWHQVLLRAPVKPVEECTAHVLAQLKQRGCKMIGLTARYTEMAYSTVEALRSVSIDFSDSNETQHDRSLFTHYPAKCINGIVFAGLQNDKADVLIQYLQQNPTSYTKIIFIDDKRKNVESMARAARVLNKPYEGVWYRYMEATPDVYQRETARLQSVLFGQILPDPVAQEIVDSAEWKMASTPIY